MPNEPQWVNIDGTNEHVYLYVALARYFPEQFGQCIARATNGGTLTAEWLIIALRDLAIKWLKEEGIMLESEILDVSSVRSWSYGNMRYLEITALGKLTTQLQVNM